MPRIVGIDIPPDKPIRISLRYVYGIGPVNAMVILKEAAIDPQKRARELNEDEDGKIVNIIDRSVHCGRCPAASDSTEHSAPQGHLLLSWLAPSPQPACPRPAHPFQRPYPEGAAQDGRRQEGREGTARING